MEWETVIGLEIHVQLSTKSKIFSTSSTTFGSEPNTQANAVDLAMPGTLPVLNERALRYAIMFGLAIKSPINKRSIFDRKNYFYPDLPKGYQTTQMDEPIVGPGIVEVQLTNGEHKQIRIHHAHLEEDAGKSLHEGLGSMNQGFSGIDLNRAGTPLIEIVSEPDMRSSEEAVAFARKIHAIVTSLGISDGEMSQGSMRFDVNVSVRLKGQEEYGTRTETKNLNSYKFMEEAIAMEVERQIDILEDGGQIAQETRLYNADTRTARSMRSKEEANDYRYFPCPDLLPVEIDDKYIETIATTLPELPDARQTRFTETYGLSDYDANILSGDRHMATYFETVTNTCNNAKLAANWIIGDVSAKINAAESTVKNINESPISAEDLAGLIIRITDNTISGKIAKQVFDAMWNGEGDADTIIENKGLKQVSDSGALETLVADVIASNQNQVDNYRKAEPDKRKKMLGFFVGQIMKASKGQANPGMVNTLLLEKLDG
ncbi:MAG: aspartyl-tRNA(Asn)/glutamyl-tRNA(Gln) amidotransferase subunit B [Oceanicoccus sp.]|jgi:aspartyl-tRNA(Asn)/glutamyl-tRNA(Gln) amidotransferase subunit B